MPRKTALAQKPIETQIFLVRGQKVLLDSDLAALYRVEVRALNQAIKRNEDRFPPDFVFQLTAKENDTLRSHFVISNAGGAVVAIFLTPSPSTVPSWPPACSTPRAQWR